MEENWKEPAEKKPKEADEKFKRKEIQSQVFQEISIFHGVYGNFGSKEENCT